MVRRIQLTYEIFTDQIVHFIAIIKLVVLIMAWKRQICHVANHIVRIIVEMVSEAAPSEGYNIRKLLLRLLVVFLRQEIVDFLLLKWFIRL